MPERSEKPMRSMKDRKAMFKTGGFLLLALWLASMIPGCSPGQIGLPQPTVGDPQSPLVNFVFSDSPKTIILSADIHYPGLPEPTRTSEDRYCDYLPALRIWGDGFVFLDEKILNQRDAVLSGQLAQEALQSVAETLVEADFLANVTPEVSPSGISCRLGLQLPGGQIRERETGTCPPVYQQVVEQIKPALTPLADQAQVDARVEALLKDNQGCNEYLKTK